MHGAFQKAHGHVLKDAFLHILAEIVETKSKKPTSRL